MKPVQVRMARAALNWSRDDLAEACGVHRNTIMNFETEKVGADPDTVVAIRAALESAGMIFIKEGREGTGVRLRKNAK